MAKVVGVVRFFSIVLFLGILGMIYAYLPVKVQLLPEGDLQVDRATFFYGTASLFLIVNIVFVVITRTLEKSLRRVSENLFAWLKAGSPVLNVYITLLVGFIGVINNSVDVSPSSYAYLNFLGPIIVLTWIGGLLYLVFKAKGVPTEG
ncbi:MAG: hypothetical protein AAGA85_02290 [Bacteroidota bacterium]